MLVPAIGQKVGSGWTESRAGAVRRMGGADIFAGAYGSSDSACTTVSQFVGGSGGGGGRGDSGSGSGSGLYGGYSGYGGYGGYGGYCGGGGCVSGINRRVVASILMALRLLPPLDKKCRWQELMMFDLRASPRWLTGNSRVEC